MMEYPDYPTSLVQRTTVMDAINGTIKENHFSDRAFYVADLADVVEKIRVWNAKLPRVHPFYAVKCNSDTLLLHLMSSLGMGFDCASKEEINAVMEVGAKPSDIIYANPFKDPAHLSYAESMNVDLMTFDCESELLKIKEIYPDARLVIRLRTPNFPSEFPLNKKFGCAFSDCSRLLSLARQVDMNVVGVSFHVGSLLMEPSDLARAIGMASKVFGMAKDLGMDFKLLDIGGGFPGHSGSYAMFNKMCYYINQSLDEYFPERDNRDLTVIAEPGCYLTCSAFTLCTKIIGKKQAKPSAEFSEDKLVEMMYYLNDGVYGAFIEGIHKYRNRVIPLLNQSETIRRRKMASKLWGMTCCSGDEIMDLCYLPEMELGEYILFENMGAYSSSLASNFNGFKKAATRYVYSPRNGMPTKLPKAFAQSTAGSKYFNKKPDSICDDDSNSDLCRKG